jgi:hypothetical protein
MQQQDELPSPLDVDHLLHHISLSLICSSRTSLHHQLTSIISTSFPRSPCPPCILGRARHLHRLPP